MIAQAPIIARLKAASFSQVQGIIEFAGLKEAPRAVPALFVVANRESAQPSRTHGIIDQRVTLGFSVVLVLAGEALAKGKASEALALEVARIQDALVGWHHPDASAPVEYAGGSLLSADGYRLAWSVQFTCPYHLRKHPQ